MKKKNIPENPKETPKTLRVLSYNIHQGITASKRQIGLRLLKDALTGLKADIVMLQEVAGSTHFDLKAKGNTELAYQLELLADTIWPYHAFQKNAVFSGGYHGNAILSRYPILKWNVLNMSVTRLARRGALHAEIEVPGLKGPVHVVGTHLGLLQYERHRQLRKLCHYITAKVPTGSPVLLAGDFNDWRESLSDRLEDQLNLEEAFRKHHTRHARTFPSRMPVLRLDRIYFRGFDLNSATRLSGRPWSQLSDHLPIVAHFSVRRRA